MLNSTDRMANEKAERETAAKSARKSEEASIVAGLRAVLQADEQLLGFARARIAGGIKGRLNIGPEAFFAPFVNIGLTERRFVIQHLHGETGKPSEILPHFFALADLQNIHFADIETYGGTPASRLVLHLANGQSFRLRLTGENNFASSKSLAEVFRSLTSVRKSASGPTHRVCISCRHIMDRPSKFCPYCGTSQMDVDVDSPAAPYSTGTDEDFIQPDANSDIEKVKVIITETRKDLLDDALAFISDEAVEPPVTASGSAPESGEVISDSTHQEPAAESTSDTSDPIVGDLDVTELAEPTASASDVTESTEPTATAPELTDTPQPNARTPDLTDTLQPAASTFEVTDAPDEIAGSANADPNDLPVHRPAPVDAFPDYSPHSSWQAAAASTTHPLSSDVSPTDEAPIADDVRSPEADDMPPPSTYSEAGSSATNTVPVEEVPQMPGDSDSAAGPLRVHFHIDHPAVRFNEVVTGKDADEVVSKLKDRVVTQLKFPMKLYAMRLSPLEFAQEIVSKYNQEQRQALSRPNSCSEFLHMVQVIGYATFDAA